ncbi:helix-turn-helix domain-containing protein [Rahnella woolbedingensis]|uniref:Helix-turn-helix domain-containing protein n=1 Tax=Rahnella woolbedingensis TaxID=1510574 RepID=A0A419N1U0_9GAMM|nr:helix-turn-helix domain-containing protein [Rahnella woolbedingensis]RJT31941.1 helix-turn-helix domain-containing protein [Rahnella woolbedingensis]
MMTANSYEAALNATATLINAVPLLGGSHSREDYEQALEMVERLIDTDDENPLIDLLAKKIADYENSTPEFEAFNTRIAALPQELAMLRVLMDQHGLNQSSFKEEIGARSLVSMILKGERKLTLEHMKALSKRFGLPVSAFIDENA